MKTILLNKPFIEQFHLEYSITSIVGEIEKQRQTPLLDPTSMCIDSETADRPEEKVEQKPESGKSESSDDEEKVSADQGLNWLHGEINDLKTKNSLLDLVVEKKKQEVASKTAELKNRFNNLPSQKQLEVLSFLASNKMDLASLISDNSTQTQETQNSKKPRT